MLQSIETLQAIRQGGGRGHFRSLQESLKKKGIRTPNNAMRKNCRASGPKENVKDGNQFARKEIGLEERGMGEVEGERRWGEVFRPSNRATSETSIKDADRVSVRENW